MTPSCANMPTCPNILHLLADDMRPQLKTYGQYYMRTPHLDQLAQTGLQFDFAFTQFACEMSGMGTRTPETTKLEFIATQVCALRLKRVPIPLVIDCAPSRNSFMSGRRPDRTRALNFLTTFRQAPDGAEWVTMPQFFKNAGYFTSSAGKVFHDGMDDPQSWSYASNQTKWLPCGPGDLEPEGGKNCEPEPRKHGSCVCGLHPIHSIQG